MWHIEEQVGVSEGGQGKTASERTSAEWSLGEGEAKQVSRDGVTTEAALKKLPSIFSQERKE